MLFWFLLNFLFILASFNILALLSMSHNFSNNFSGWWKSSSYTFPEQLSNLISYKSSCLLLLLEVCKNHYKKENISVGSSEQQREAFFWIYLKEMWLNIFVLLLVALNFSTFIFSVGIKLFIWHQVVFYCILILLEQFDDFVQLPPWCIPKDS